jgi:hypothetical protein
MQTKDPKFKNIMTNPGPRRDMLNMLKKNPMLHYRALNKRNESLSGWLEEYIYQESVNGAVTSGLTGVYDGYNDVPFFAHELCVYQHAAYMNLKLTAPDKKTKTISVPENSAELDQEFARITTYKDSETLAWQATDGDDDYTLMFSIEPKELFGRGNTTPYAKHVGSNLVYSDNMPKLLSTRPIIYKTPNPHMLFDWDIEIAIVKTPADLLNDPKRTPPSLMTCMNEFHQNLIKEAYGLDPKPHEKYLGNWENRQPKKMKSPYQEGHIYQTNLGPYDVYAVPEKNIVKSLLMDSKIFITELQKNPQALSDQLVQKLVL